MVPFVEFSLVSEVGVVVSPEVIVVWTVMMLVIMVILVLLGMIVAGFEGVVSEAMGVMVMGIRLLFISSNWVVDTCWTWSRSE